MSPQRTSREFVSGIPELLVLSLLADSEMYGYEIVQNIRRKSEHRFDFGEGVIYPLLHAMHKRRLLKTRKVNVNGRQRIYYQLTKAGQKKLATKTDKWRLVSEAVERFLSEPTHATSAAR